MIWDLKSKKGVKSNIQDVLKDDYEDMNENIDKLDNILMDINLEIWKLFWKDKNYFYNFEKSEESIEKFNNDLLKDDSLFRWFFDLYNKCFDFKSIQEYSLNKQEEELVNESNNQIIVEINSFFDFLNKNFWKEVEIENIKLNFWFISIFLKKDEILNNWIWLKIIWENDFNNLKWQYSDLLTKYWSEYKSLKINWDINGYLNNIVNLSNKMKIEINELKEKYKNLFLEKLDLFNFNILKEKKIDSSGNEVWYKLWNTSKELYQMLKFFWVDYYYNKESKFWYKYPVFISNENKSSFIFDTLQWNYNKVRCFDLYLYGFFDKISEEDLKMNINEKLWNYNNKTIDVNLDSNEYDSILKNFNNNIRLLYQFKNFQIKNIKTTHNNNTLFDQSIWKQKYIYEKDIFPYIKNIEFFKWNLNFLNENYIWKVNDIWFIKNIEDKFKNKEFIEYEDFLKYCNYFEDTNKIKNNHEVNYLFSKEIKEIKKSIESYKHIIFFDFETTSLNYYRNNEILESSFLVTTNKGEVLAKKELFIDHEKNNINNDILKVYDYEEYKNKENKISKKQFIEFIEKLKNYYPNSLFVWQNVFKFDIEVLKNHYNDLWEKLNWIDLYDLRYLSEIYYKEKWLKEYKNIYKNLDGLLKREWLIWRVDKAKHWSLEDVKMTKELFFTYIK